MPITEVEMSYEDMKKAVDNGYLCGKCQGALVIAWSAEKNCYILRCGNDITHTGITRHDKKYEQKLKEGLSMDSTALMTMAETKMMERVDMARFPQELTKEEKRLLAQGAITYGFDPLMGEVTIYQGKPYVSIDGRYRKAQETNKLDGVETRPATKQERTDWQIPEGDYFFRSAVYVIGTTHPFVAWGRVISAETNINKPGDAYKPVVKNPQRMAEKRAEAQALRKAFHIPLPNVEDIGSPEYDVESTTREVNTTTGEIKEPPPEEHKEKPKQKPKAKANPEPAPESPQATAEATPVETSPIDLVWLRDSLQKLQWADVGGYLQRTYKVKGASVSAMVTQLDKEQAESFVKEVEERLSLL